MKYQKQKSVKKIPFDIATRNIKYLGINLTKEGKDLYSENYTTLKKEIKEDTDQTSGQDGGAGRHTVPPCTTKRTTTNLKRKNNQN